QGRASVLVCAAEAGASPSNTLATVTASLLTRSRIRNASFIVARRYQLPKAHGYRMKGGMAFLGFWCPSLPAGRREGDRHEHPGARSRFARQLEAPAQVVESLPQVAQAIARRPRGGRVEAAAIVLNAHLQGGVLQTDSHPHLGGGGVL